MSPGKKLIYTSCIIGLILVMSLALFTACDNRKAVNAKVSSNAKVTITLSQTDLVTHSLTEPDTVSIELRARDSEGNGMDSVQISLFRSPDIGSISPPGITGNGGFASAYFITDPGSGEDTTITFIAKAGTGADTAELHVSYTAANVIMTVSPSILTVHSETEPDSAKITIIVRDQEGNGIANEEVQLTRTPQVGTMVNPPATESNGMTSSWFITDPGSSDDTLITFVATSSAGTDSIQLKIDYAYPTVSMNLIPPQLIVKSQTKPDTVDIDIRVRDENGNGIDSVQVNLSRTPLVGTIVPPALTSEGGYASAKYITDLNIQEDQQVIFTAVANGMVDVDTLDILLSLQGEIDTMKISLDKTTLVADGADEASIFVSVLDTTGIPIGDGTVIHMEKYGALVSGVLDSATVKTVGGIAVFTIKSPPVIDTSRVIDVDTLHAFGVSSSGTVKHAYSFITYVPGQPATLEIVTQPVAMVSGSGQSQNIRVKVSDDQGSFVRNGTQVKFFNEMISSNITSITTTEDGYATAIYTVGTQAGTDFVKALYLKPGTIDSLTSGQVGIPIASSAPTNIALRAVSPRIEVGGISTIVQATMQDENSNPLSEGWDIRFEIVQAPADSGTPAPSFKYVSTNDSLLRVAVEPTNVSGVASISLFSGTRSGTVSIRATSVDDENIFKQKNLITIESGPPYIIQIGASNIAEAYEEELRTGITAAVWDSFTNPVEPLTAIHFQVIPDSFAFINGAAVTGGWVNPDDLDETIGVRGLASTWMYYASYETFDTVRVIAESGGMVDTSGAITLAIYDPSVTVDAIPSVLYCSGVGDQDTSQITALLLDGLGIPISNGIILFTNSGCGQIDEDAVLDTTDDYGIATTIFTILYGQIPYAPPDILGCEAIVEAKLRGYPDIIGEESIYCTRQN